METVLETVFVLFYGVTLTLLCFFGCHRAFMVYLYYRHRNNNPKLPENNAYWPLVTIQLPMYNEKLVADRLIRAVAKIRYPAGKLEIQVLDDSKDETVQIARRVVMELRAQGMDISYIHRKKNTGYKAGALENGSKLAKGELIAIFDADFIPTADFLEKTVPHFANPKVGMVQVRWDHINPHQSLLTRIQAMLLDGHFVMESAARSRAGRFFNFNGTAGFWHHDTLTEDLDLSYRAQMRGWKFIFLQDYTVPAELPIEMNAFKSQQFRWSKGSTQTAKKILPMLWRSDMPFRVKLEGLFHLGGHISYPLLLLLCLLLPFSVWFWRDDPFKGWSISIYHIFFLGTFSVALFYTTAGLEGKRGLLNYFIMLFPLMSLGAGMTVNNSRAVIEGIKGKDSPFVRTPKYLADGSTNKEGYSAQRDPYSWAELAMGLHLTAGVFLALQYQIYPALPFMMMFQCGFLYVSLSSLAQEHESRKLAEEMASEPTGQTI
jgi:cellulose synthase/poly-beta-1,6-N-acetylglucosamine synthase-like glycosyltransferase